MATLNTIRRAQVSKSCDLCKLDLKIKWICNPCHMFLCEDCRQMHSDAKSSINHDIVSIYSFETPDDDNQLQGIIERIPCKIHRNEMCEKFCETCDVTVCLSCTLGFHMGHIFKQIDKLCRERIQICAGRISKDLSFCKIEERQIMKTKEICNSKYDESLNSIRLKEKELKDQITQYADILCNEIEEDKTVFLESCKERSNKIDSFKQDLKNKQKQFQTAMDSKRTKVILNTISELKDSLPDLTSHQPPREMKSFGDSKTELINLNDSFGSLEFKPNQTDDSYINFKVIHCYTTDLVFVDKIVTIDDETAWISSYITNTLRKINTEETISNVKDISFDLYDMTITPSKDILLSALYSSDIKLLTKRGQIQPFLSVEPLLPVGIHVTKNNEVIVGVTDEYTYNIKEESCRKILVFGMNGKEKRSYNTDKNNQRLFTLPRRIISNINGDILVIDDKSDFDGRLVVLNKDGHFCWDYHGNPVVNFGDRLFQPVALVTTSAGNIIVVDYYISAFHVLSMEGHILFSKTMEGERIFLPMSLNIDTKGQLWVGCYTEEGEAKAKLHIVKMHTCSQVGTKCEC